MAQIGDILAKLGRREVLTTAEQQQIRIWGNTQEHNNAFITGLQNGQSVIYAQEVNAIRGEFEYPPSGISVRLGVGIVVIPNYAGTPTDVSWTTEYYDDISMWSSDEPTIIKIKRTGKYQLAGFTRWQPVVATGNRVMYVLSEAGTPIASHIVANVSNEFQDNVLVQEINLTSGQRIKAAVSQTSGGNVSTAFVRLAIRLLRGADSES